MMEKRLEAEREQTRDRPCANEVCGCNIDENRTTAQFCSEYCVGEGTGRGDGPCQCGHIGCPDETPR